MINIIGSYNIKFKNDIDMFKELLKKTFHIKSNLMLNVYFNGIYFDSLINNIRTKITKKHIIYFDNDVRWFICMKN